MNNNRCFVCGSRNSKGLNLKYNIDKNNETAFCKTTLSNEYEGWKGYLHGGIMASILDGAMVHACLAKGLTCVTAELNIKYKNPILTGSEIEIKSEIVKNLSMLFYVSATISVAGVEAVTATAKMWVVDNLE